MHGADFLKRLDETIASHALLSHPFYQAWNAGALSADTLREYIKQYYAHVRVFLIGEAATCAHAHQKVPQGHYNIEVMLKAVLKHGGEIGVCSSCMDARGITDSELIEGTRRSSMDELTRWTAEADKALVF